MQRGLLPQLLQFAEVLILCISDLQIGTLFARDYFAHIELVRGAQIRQAFGQCILLYSIYSTLATFSNLNARSLDTMALLGSTHWLRVFPSLSGTLLSFSPALLFADVAKVHKVLLVTAPPRGLPHAGSSVQTVQLFMNHRKQDGSPLFISLALGDDFCLCSWF